MRNILIGTAVGAALAYVVVRLSKQGKLDELCDDANQLVSKTKRNLKNVVDVGENQIDYIKERIGQEVGHRTGKPSKAKK